MKILAYVLLLACLLNLSCHKKELPPSVSETESVFYFNGTIDGEPVSLKSGVDNYYMYSSNALDTVNIYNFIANFKKTNCTNCDKSIQIKIRDYKITGPNASSFIDLALMQKDYPIQGKPLYMVRFNSIYNQNAASYLWNFGDNTTSTLANPAHTYSNSGTYNLSLKITSTDNCQQFIKSNEKIRYPYKSCTVHTVKDTLNTIHLQADVQGITPFKYLWDFGDGNKDTNQLPHHTYSVAGTYPVALRVIDAVNDTSYAKYNTATRTYPMPCLTNYSISSITQIADLLAFSNVIINWIDDGGIVYTSNNFLQPSTSYFKILSVENYENNENNEKVKKIKLQLKCNVYNGNRVKAIDNVVAVVGVSYK